jgi:hypothetical protein
VRPGNHPTLSEEEFEAIEQRLAAIVGPSRARLIRLELDHSFAAASREPRRKQP